MRGWLRLVAMLAMVGNGRAFLGGGGASLPFSAMIGKGSEMLLDNCGEFRLSQRPSSPLPLLLYALLAVEIYTQHLKLNNHRCFHLIHANSC